MILFQEIRYKNILSFGNTFSTMKLNDSPTTLIVGENGAGKSTLLDALSFVLYNKPFRDFTKPQLVNSVNNRELMVEVDFKKSKVNYTIKRGIKPNLFEIWKDGVMLPQDASVREYQQKLEKYILQMNYIAFTQIVILGKATYTPFMRLNAQNRRNMIEEILGLSVFSKMKESLKSKMSLSVERLSGLEATYNNLEYEISAVRDFISRINQSSDNQIAMFNDEIENYQDIIDDTQKHRDKHVNLANKLDISNLTNQLTSYNTIDNKYIQYDRDFLNKIKKFKVDLNFFNDNNLCPTCSQDISTEFQVEKTNQIESSINKLQTAHVKLNNEMKSNQQLVVEVTNHINEYDKLQSVINDANIQIQKNQSLIGNLQSQITVIRNDDTDINEYVSKLSDLECDLKQTQGNKQKQIEVLSDYKSMSIMLKDNGIKSVIVQKYLPIFNYKINHFLNELGLFINFTLDSEFKESIESHNRDKFTYNSFSEGEKLRIDLAMMLTFREISKLKNSMTTNLLILDEIFDSSLDTSGVDAFIDGLPKIEDVNIFVVSHSPEKLIDKFRTLINIKKVGNFSEIVTE